jgi:hypothetical protein
MRISRLSAFLDFQDRKGRALDAILPLQREVLDAKSRHFFLAIQEVGEGSQWLSQEEAGLL